MLVITTTCIIQLGDFSQKLTKNCGVPNLGKLIFFTTDFFCPAIGAFFQSHIASIPGWLQFFIGDFNHVVRQSHSLLSISSSVKRLCQRQKETWRLSTSCL